MSRCVVTGGLGFIGSALVRHLVRRGEDVLVLDREGQDAFRLAPVASRVKLHRCDLFDQKAWHARVAEHAPERVFHLAWYAEPGKYLTSDQNLDHLAGGIAFTRALLALRPRDFVITGTCFEYRMTGEPLVEDETPEEPRHLYSACKLALKNVALQLARDAGVPLVWARIFYLYGPYEDPRRLVPLLARAARSGEPVALRSHGRQVRDFLHVRDVAAGIDAAAKLGRPGVVNVGSGEPVSVRELAHAIEAVFGRRGIVTFAADDTPLDEPMRVEASASRLRGLGWCPSVALDREALAERDDG